MKLVCPQCQYSKELDDAVIPAEMVYATCPQCSSRFRFRGVEPEQAPDAENGVVAGAGEVARPRMNSVRFVARQTGCETDSAEPGVLNNGQEDHPSGTEYFGPDSKLFHDHAVEGQDDARNPVLPDIPWAHRGDIGRPAAFMATVRAVLLTPAVFFARAGSEWKKAGVIPFYAFCTALGMFFAQVWAWAIATFLGNILSDAAVLASGGEFLGWGTVLFMTAAIAILSPLLLLISAGIIHVCLRVLGAGRGGFGATAMVCGFGICANVLYMVPFIGQFLAALWGLFVLLVGLKHAHKTTMWRVVASLLLPLVVLFLFIVAAGLLNH